MKISTCSFFGHRKVNITEELQQKIKDVIEDLIINHNVKIFLFGSRSTFDEECHIIVSTLKKKYLDIERVAYTCKSETCILVSDRQQWQETYALLKKPYNQLLEVDKECEHKTKYTSGRASYVERNQAMINDSDYCILYYDPNYETETKKFSKRSIGFYQPKSGTALAYTYATQKKKTIINLFEN